jgi:broad specificity phosphatase PhoE
MARVTRVILVRHADTGFRGKYYLGLKDVPITREGIEHARRVGEALKRLKVDRIYSSRIRRAVMTAGEIAKQSGLVVEQREEFNELDFGVMDGLTAEEVEERYPGLVGKRDMDKENFRPPKGESYAHARKRVMPAFRKLFEENEGKTVLVVMHGVLMKIIFREVAGRDISEAGEYVGFGCRMYFEKSGGRIGFVRLENDVELETEQQAQKGQGA